AAHRHRLHLHSFPTRRSSDLTLLTMTQFPNNQHEPGSTPQDRERTGARGSGWYRDPYGALEQQRWYDGRKWTRAVRDRPADEERSEEHTSELQSPYELVCRLL